MKNLRIKEGGLIMYKLIYNKIRECINMYKKAINAKSEFIFFSECWPICLFICDILGLCLFVGFLFTYFPDKKLSIQLFVRLLFLLIFLGLLSWLKGFSISLNKSYIREKINLFIKNSPNKVLKTQLSRIITESNIKKEAFQRKLNSPILNNFINQLILIMSFFLGFFANILSESFKQLYNKNIHAINIKNINDFSESFLILILMCIVLVFALYSIYVFFNSRKLYYIEMFDYQSKYAEYLNSELTSK
jgi:hypothetical protein